MDWKSSQGKSPVSDKHYQVLVLAIRILTTRCPQIPHIFKYVRRTRAQFNSTQFIYPAPFTVRLSLGAPGGQGLFCAPFAQRKAFTRWRDAVVVGWGTISAVQDELPAPFQPKLPRFSSVLLGMYRIFILYSIKHQQLSHLKTGLFYGRCLLP